MELTLFQLTSFRETPFETYNNNKDRLIKFKECIPISHHDDPSGDNAGQLSLAFGWLRSKSWDRLQHLLLVHINNLWKYDWHKGSHAYDQRLNKESYERSMRMFRMEGDEYESTETVLVAARLRLRNLARQEAVKLHEKYRLQSERRSGPDAFSEVDLEDSHIKTPSLANTNRSHDNAGQELGQESVAATKHWKTQTSRANCSCSTVESASSRGRQSRATYTMTPQYPPSALVNRQITPDSERKHCAASSSNEPRDHDFPIPEVSPPGPILSTAPVPGPVYRPPQLPLHPHLATFHHMLRQTST